jgi:hypothetical protein
VIVFVCRANEFGAISGVTNVRLKLSPIGGVVGEVPRCSPVKLAGENAVPEFVMFHDTVTTSPGRAE